jgi:hypothetical protein
MQLQEYRNCHKLIRTYLNLEGYKVKYIATSLPQCECPKCRKVLDFSKDGFMLGLSKRVIFYYQAICSTCKITLIHKTIELENLEEGEGKE